MTLQGEGTPVPAPGTLAEGSHATEATTGRIAKALWSGYRPFRSRESELESLLEPEAQLEAEDVVAELATPLRRRRFDGVPWQPLVLAVVLLGMAAAFFAAAAWTGEPQPRSAAGHATEFSEPLRPVRKVLVPMPMSCKVIGCAFKPGAPCNCGPVCQQGKQNNCCPDVMTVCPAKPAPGLPGGKPMSGAVVGGVRKWSQHGFDCREGPLPPPIWGHGAGDTMFRVMTFNLFWWQLFDQGKQGGGASGFHRSTTGNEGTKLIASSHQETPYDVMGFQECEDAPWVLEMAGLAQEFDIFRDRACCFAYRKTHWEVIPPGHGSTFVSMDHQFWKRPAQWMRLKNRATGKTAFFMNHHGALPINSGGACGPKSMAWELLHIITKNARPEDAVVLVGDFNADMSAPIIKLLSTLLKHSYGGQSTEGAHQSFGNFDHVFSNMDPAAMVNAAPVGFGGSDHQMLRVDFKI